MLFSSSRKYTSTISLVAQEKNVITLFFIFFFSRSKHNGILIKTKVQSKEEISFHQNIRPEQGIKPPSYKEYLQDPCYPIS